MIRKILNSCLSLIILIGITSPAQAQENSAPHTHIQATNIQASVGSFLAEFNLINCFRKKPSDTRRFISQEEFYCLIMRSTGQTYLSPRKAFRESIKQGFHAGERKLRKTVNLGEALSAALKANGINIPPFIDKKNWNIKGVRPTDRYAAPFRTAIEIGILDAEEVLKTSKKMRRDEALGLLYKISLIEQANQTIINIVPNNQESFSSVPYADVLAKVLNTLKQKSYYNQSFNKRRAMEKALKAIVKSIEEDKYAEFYTSQEFKAFFTNLKGKFFGIGAYIEQRDGKIIIVSPIIGSPAEKSGLLAGDIVLAIDGVSTEGMTLQEAVNRIRGPLGTMVQLTVGRERAPSVNIAITRGEINIPSLSRSRQGNVEIIEIYQFNEGLAEELEQHLTEIMQQQPAALIIDLRNNPGGLLSEVTRVLDYFLEKGSPIVAIETTDGTNNITANRDKSFHGINTNILINAGSASASEIMAGTLKAYGKATIWGKTSFGKGSVQEIFNMGEGAVKYTTAKYLIPKGINDEVTKIDGVGVIPEREIEDDPETEEDEAILAILNEFKVARGRR